MTENELRWAVAAIIFALGVYMAARSALLRRSGVPVNQLAARGNLAQRAIIGLGVLFGGYLLARAPFPALDYWTATQASPAPFAAIAVLLAGGVIIIAAQGGMGRSWRVGVPAGEGDVEKLVTKGLNRISRNPTYLGIMVFLIGTGLAAPGPLTLAAIVLSFAALSFIISREEKYLKEKFGADYDAYARRVRRWI